MIPSIQAVLCAGFLTFVPAAAVDVTPSTVDSLSTADDKDAIKALDLWLKAYRKGKLDLVNLDRFKKGTRFTAKDFVSVKLGVISPSRVHNLNYEKELRILCEKIAALGDASAVSALLDVAAIGLDNKKHKAEELTGLVRGIGAQALATMRGKPAHEALRSIAGELKGARSRAALRALGHFSDEVDWPIFEKAFGNAEASVRVAAAIGLRNAKNPNSLELLADQAGRDKSSRVVAACFDALAAVAEKADAQQSGRGLRRATTTAIDVLGVFDWQTDDAAIGFLERVRSQDTVPAMIGVLERWADAAKPGKASGVVRLRAHELLVSLSGANFPMGQPAQWRQWWERVHDDFEVVAEKSEADRKKSAGETTTGTFFGIPVRGSHVLFIVDFSGSMQFPSIERAEKGGRLATKMQVARRELKGATSKLAADGAFNLVWFNTKTGQWKPKLVPATQANKKKFAKFLDKSEPEGGTNLWGGLEAGLKVKTITDASERYESHVDEIFILSDGLPSAGDVIDPAHILANVRDANQTRRVRINTVFVTGSEDSQRSNPRGGPPPFEMQAPELMRRLAEENGGVFIQPGGEDDRRGGGRGPGGR